MLMLIFAQLAESGPRFLVQLRKPRTPLAGIPGGSWETPVFANAPVQRLCATLCGLDRRASNPEILGSGPHSGLFDIFAVQAHLRANATLC